MRQYRRAAFTLVELLVVIAIILIVTAIGVLAIPSSQDRTMQAGADQLQGWLLVAKQRAKREGRPTGLRLIPDPNNANLFVQCQYIYQPDDYDVPGTTCLCAGNTTVTFQSGVNPQGVPVMVDLIGAGVQIGDYIEFNRGGGVYQISGVAAGTLTLAVNGPDMQGTATSEYRIRRQPVLLPGEETLNLPDGLAIDNSGTANQSSINVPARTVGTTTFNEILFAPQGGLVGRGTGSDQLCVLWLANQRNNGSFPLLIGIQNHTGFIGVYAQNTDPSKLGGSVYANCRDGRNSGL